MQFSLVNGIKTEAMPGGKGICSCCGSETIAKCGKYKIWHWSHKSKKNCDTWWENETKWHRLWKSYFPKAWQEEVLFDRETNEKHIADVKTANQMVIEFQNSPIKHEEVASREAFYKKMFWIVNASDPANRAYFNISFKEKISANPLIYLLDWRRRSKLLEKWSFSSCPVFFDLGSDYDYLLWLLEYNPKSQEGKVRIILKQDLVNKNGGTYRVNSIALTSDPKKQENCQDNDPELEREYGMTLEEYGKLQDEYEQKLQEEYEALAQYEDYSVLLISSSDLGATEAPYIAEKARKEFPGIQISFDEQDSDIDGLASVMGEDEEICAIIQNWFDRQRP